MKNQPLHLKIQQELLSEILAGKLLTVPLRTVQQPRRDIALTAFHAMRERMVAPALPVRSLLLTPRLMVRESCGAYPSRWILSVGWS